MDAAGIAGSSPAGPDRPGKSSSEESDTLCWIVGRPGGTEHLTLTFCNTTSNVPEAFHRSAHLVNSPVLDRSV
jgi:hypothetical protein